VIARLNNRGPHTTCYRGLVVLHADGRLTWFDGGDVQVWHGDVLAEITAVRS